MTDNCLEIKSLSKGFRGFKLDNISFSLPRGYIMGFVGANGAGKTTTMRLILNMLNSDSGEITVFGKNSVKDETAIKQDIGVVFDSIFYAENWTVKDTERAVSIFYDNWNHDTFSDYIDRFGLPRNKKVKDFSRGMQMKLMLACALSHEAKLLLLDEPTSGLDPVTRGEFLDILQEYIKNGENSVLFSTHITSDLERIADYITLINKGKLIFTGSREDLLDRWRIIRGGLRDLSPQLEGSIIGLRKTNIGFEGLIDAGETQKYKNCVFDAAAIDDIVVHVSKGGSGI